MKYIFDLVDNSYQIIIDKIKSLGRRDKVYLCFKKLMNDDDHFCKLLISNNIDYGYSRDRVRSLACVLSSEMSLCNKPTIFICVNVPPFSMTMIKEKIIHTENGKNLKEIIFLSTKKENVEDWAKLFVKQCDINIDVSVFGEKIDVAQVKAELNKTTHKSAPKVDGKVTNEVKVAKKESSETTSETNNETKSSAEKVLEKKDIAKKISEDKVVQKESSKGEKIIAKEIPQKKGTSVHTHDAAVKNNHKANEAAKLNSNTQDKQKIVKKMDKPVKINNDQEKSEKVINKPEVKAKVVNTEQNDKEISSDVKSHTKKNKEENTATCNEKKQTTESVDNKSVVKKQKSISETLMIIKAHIVKENKHWDVVRDIEKYGIRIVKAEFKYFGIEFYKKFYKHVEKYDFFENMCKAYSENEVLILYAQGDDCLNHVRHILGKTNPDQCELWNIRRIYGNSSMLNAIHASGSESDYKKEKCLISEYEEGFEL